GGGIRRASTPGGPAAGTGQGGGTRSTAASPSLPRPGCAALAASAATHTQHPPEDAHAATTSRRREPPRQGPPTAQQNTAGPPGPAQSRNRSHPPGLRPAAVVNLTTLAKTTACRQKTAPNTL